MAKLRKMLGKIDEPAVTALMDLIETQSKTTLAEWAVSYAENHFLEIYEKTYSNDFRFRETIGAVKECIGGKKKLSEIKALLKEARQIAMEAEENPAAVAAARAVATACGTIQTPTNALGFTFYGAAAAVYDKAGLSEKPEIYDEMASKELEKILESLKESAIPNETNPVKIKWNC